VQRVGPAGKKPDFWPVSKFNTGSLPLCGILPVSKYALWALTLGLREWWTHNLSFTLLSLVTTQN